MIKTGNPWTGELGPGVDIDLHQRESTFGSDDAYVISKRRQQRVGPPEADLMSF